MAVEYTATLLYAAGLLCQQQHCMAVQMLRGCKAGSGASVLRCTVGSRSDLGQASLAVAMLAGDKTGHRDGHGACSDDIPVLIVSCIVHKMMGRQMGRLHSRGCGNVWSLAARY